MPAPAGTGLDRRELPAARARPRRRRLRRRGAAAGGVRGRDRGRAGGGAAKGRVLVSVFLDGGADSLSMLFPAGDPLYRKLRPKLALAPDQGVAFAEDDRLRWHPSLAPLAALHGEGKVTVMPGIGYDHPNQSHFTSRHFWEVGALDERLADRLARALPRPLRLARQPAAGARARLGAAAGARDEAGAGRVDRRPRPVRLLDARRLGRRRRSGCSTRSARSAGSRARRPRPRAGDRRRAPDRAALPAAGAVPREGRRGEGLREPGRVPRRRRLVPAPARRPRGDARRAACRSAASRSSAPGSYDTHDDQAGGLADGLKLTADSLLAFQRDLEARGSPTACSCSSGRSSAAAPRRTARAAPITAPPARAS